MTNGDDLFKLAGMFQHIEVIEVINGGTMLRIRCAKCGAVGTCLNSLTAMLIKTSEVHVH